MTVRLPAALLFVYCTHIHSLCECTYALLVTFSSHLHNRFSAGWLQSVRPSGSRGLKQRKGGRCKQASKHAVGWRRWEGAEGSLKLHATLGAGGGFRGRVRGTGPWRPSAAPAACQAVKRPACLVWAQAERPRQRRGACLRSPGNGLTRGGFFPSPKPLPSLAQGCCSFSKEFHSA